MSDAPSHRSTISRRGALLRVGSGVGTLLASERLLGVFHLRTAYAQAGGDPTAALQLAARALNLQRAFYAAGITTPVVFNALSAGERSAVQQASKQDDAADAHLRTQLGASAPPIPTYSYTAGGAFPAVMTTRADFLEVAQLLEDATVRLLKAQLPSLVGDAPEMRLLARLHQVQSRHAGEIRRLRGQTAWINGAAFDAGYGGSATTAGTQASVARLVYGAPVTVASQVAQSEDNRVQVGLLGQRTDAFDEPLPSADATAFLQLFGA